MAHAIRIAVFALIGLMITAAPAYSIGGGGSKTPSGDPNYMKAVELVKSEKYADAIPLLQKAVASDPANADAFNYLGYSHRKIGQFDAALKHYQSALELQPDHRGANEYLGELYLELGELEKAEERLAVLDKACFFGCEEYSELKEAITDYKRRQGTS